MGPGGHVASEHFCAAVESNCCCHTSSRYGALLHRLYTILLSLAQSQHTVLPALGPCISSAGGHRHVMTGNENAEGSEITVNELMILKDRSYIYCE